MEDDTTLDFELEGQVFVVERDKDGNIVSKEEISGEVVLKCLVLLLEEALKKEQEK